MGSLSYGELAGERMKLGLLLHDPEEEHDCFSDNTYNSHLNDAIGIHERLYRQIYPRRRQRDGRPVAVGPRDRARMPALDTEITRQARQDHRRRCDAMAKRGETGEAYDQMIGEGNTEGNAVVQAAIDGLIAQTSRIERAVAALKLGNDRTSKAPTASTILSRVPVSHRQEARHDPPRWTAMTKNWLIALPALALVSAAL